MIHVPMTAAIARSRTVGDAMDVVVSMIIAGITIVGTVEVGIVIMRGIVNATVAMAEMTEEEEEEEEEGDGMIGGTDGGNLEVDGCRTSKGTMIFNFFTFILLSFSMPCSTLCDIILIFYSYSWVATLNALSFCTLLLLFLL